MTLTVDQIMSYSPCLTYPRSRVKALWAGRPSLTLLEILDLDIPAEDRVWVLTRPRFLNRPGVLTEAQTKAFLDRVVTRAVTTHVLHCGIPAAEAWASGWLDGTDRSLRGARGFARWGRPTAWNEVVFWTVSAAVSAVLRDAARGAHQAAQVAWAAQQCTRLAWDAERQAQVEDLRLVLKEEKTMEKNERIKGMLTVQEVCDVALDWEARMDALVKRIGLSPENSPMDVVRAAGSSLRADIRAYLSLRDSKRDPTLPG
jgi:hypothetical protein